MAGWFKINRDIQSHWIWESNEPFDKRSAWIDLIMLANHKDFKTTYKGRVVQRKRGDVNTSIRFLADRWHWDRRKVGRFIGAMQQDGMCTMHSTTDGTTITIVNYNKYQNKSTTDGTTYSADDAPQKSTTDGTTYVPYDKNYKNLKNISIYDKGQNPSKESQGMTNDEKDEFLARARSKFNRTIAKEQI